MNHDIDIFAPVNNIGDCEALESWRWLVGKSASVRLLTAMGNIFFVKSHGIFRRESVFFIDTNEGTVEMASGSWTNFRTIIKSMENVPGQWLNTVY
ncbi:MAG: hypothetical protein ACJAWL_003310 [Motiliproteus sp.]|jgi:hypothetical protein